MTTDSHTAVPVTVIGGYLGAGKTTLVNHLLRSAAGVRYALLVNDFGAINIDAELIESFDGETLQLSNGCICCSVAGGFTEALLALRARDHRPDRVVVEASGVADPVATAQYAHLDGFELDSIVVVADAETVRRRAGDRYVGRHVLRQLQGADLVILNKTDLVSVEQTAAVRGWLAERCPGIRVVDAIDADVPVAWLFAPDLRADRPAGPHASHDHDHLHRQWSFSSDGAVDAARFRDVVADLPDSVIRAKGIVALDDDLSHRSVYQRVGRRSTIRRGAPWGSEPPSTRVVFIGLPDPALPALLDAVGASLRPIPALVPEDPT